jgi:hypothetical protein
MSASKGLEELKEHYEGPYFDHLRNVLPLIVAVIDVAEKIAAMEHPIWGSDGLGFQLQDRLADLDDALQ